VIKLTDQERSDVVQMALNGSTRKEVAKAYDITTTHVGRLVRDYIDLNDVDDSVIRKLTNRTGYLKKRDFIESIEHLPENTVKELIKAWESGYRAGFSKGRYRNA
jgi:hypothetical protein